MNQKEFFQQLEERVRRIDNLQQEINNEIGLIKGLIIDYEFANRENIGKK